MNQNKSAFAGGMRDGIPIALGYFAVAFSLGIVAKKAGLNPFQGFLSSILNHASAGEYAEFTVIMANAPYFEMAFVILVTNIRYLLMSCALSQKFDSGTAMGHRLLVGFGITDEIFGIAVGKPGILNPYYSYGAMAIALPGWALGTAFGVVAGNVLPVSVVSALSVALYGMFVAIIIPAAKTSKVVGGVILFSFLASFAVSRVPLFDSLSDSMKISLLTVGIAGGAAFLFPLKDDPGPKERPMEEPDRKEESTDDPGQKEGPMEEPGRKEESTDDPGQKERPMEEPGRKEEPAEEPGQKERPMEEPGRKEEPVDELRRGGEPKDAPDQERESTNEPGEGRITVEEPSHRRVLAEEPVPGGRNEEAHKAAGQKQIGRVQENRFESGGGRI